MPTEHQHRSVHQRRPAGYEPPIPPRLSLRPPVGRPTGVQGESNLGAVVRTPVEIASSPAAPRNDSFCWVVSF
jgi:hypothetical protein